MQEALQSAVLALEVVGSHDPEVDMVDVRYSRIEDLGLKVNLRGD